MPIYEESFRIGCGRYLQGKGYIARCREELARVGTAPMIIGDDTTLALTHDKLAAALEGVRHTFITHNGTCNDERARELAELAKANGYDTVIGVGGGVLMDFAKLCAHFAELPVINIPTSSATRSSRLSREKQRFSATRVSVRWTASSSGKPR